MTPSAPPRRRRAQSPCSLERGRFTIDGQPAWTARTGYSWFQAQMPPSLAQSFGPAITRFAPGRIGTGVDRRPRGARGRAAAAVAPSTSTTASGTTAAAWTTTTTDRPSSGRATCGRRSWNCRGRAAAQGKAWDGLSKYDLARFNPWYFDRISELRRHRRSPRPDPLPQLLLPALAAREPLALRRLPVAAGRTRSRRRACRTRCRPPTCSTTSAHPLRRDLHRRYIRHALDVLGTARTSSTASTASTPGRSSSCSSGSTRSPSGSANADARVFVALEIPKDQMDAILDDPVRGPMITAIDILGWVYRADGALFAARGGINRAPREQRPDIATPEELEALKQKLGVDAARPEGLPQRAGVPEALRHAVGRLHADEVPRVARVSRRPSRPRPALERR